MAYKHFTRCFPFKPGDRPFHESDIPDLAIGGGIFSSLLGAFIGSIVGTIVGGPIGALVGVLVGIFSGTAIGLTAILNMVADDWLNHRLICLTGEQCAIGSVAFPERIGDLGQFDNDEFFDVALMPYPPDHGFRYKEAKPDRWKNNLPGIINDPNLQTHLDKNPANDPYLAPLQGKALLKPNDQIFDEFGYLTTSETTEGEERILSTLHCEAEGDFWIQIGKITGFIGIVTGLAAAGAVAAGVGGAALGCSIGGFFGPLGCLIGAIIFAILAVLLELFIASEIITGIIEESFEADPGDIEDANVGDVPLGPLKEGDRLAILGIHVYDGFHEGWNEIHPLKAVIKVPDGVPSYLQWDPNFLDSGTPPPPIDGFTGDAATELTPEDMRLGLGSPTFLARATAIRERWCHFVRDAFGEPVNEAQQGITHGWTIHPTVDGCAEPEPEPPK